MGDGMTRCVCPGSFDPVTVGHVDIIGRAAALFDEVVVVVLHNPGKPGTFGIDERLELLRGELEAAGLAAAPGTGAATGTASATGLVRVEAFSGRLLVDVCRDLDAGAIVKGLRSDTDYSYELPMALMNRHLTGVETVFLPADPRLVHISSSLVREVASLGGDVTGMVSDGIRDALVARRVARHPAPGPRD